MGRFKMFEWLTDRLENKMAKVTGPVSERHSAAGTAEEWCDYHNRQKTMCPKLYKIYKFFDDLDTSLSVWKMRYIDDPRYWFRNAIITRLWMITPKELKIDQWYDTDWRMLCANMELLRFYIEEDNHNYGNAPDDFEPWEVKEFKKKEAGEPSQFDGGYGLSMRQYQDKKDAWDIYLWWKEYPNRLKEIDQVFDDMPKRDKDEEIMFGLTKAEMEKKAPWYDKYNNLQNKLKEEEEENLIKLMKIRNSLWT